MTKPSRVAALVLGLALLGCPEPTTAPDTSPKSITLSAASASIVAGTTTQVTAEVKDGSGNTLGGQTVTFGTGDAAIITANAQGVVTSVGKAGTASVTATLGGITSNAVTITVTPDVPKTITKVTDLPASPTVASTLPISLRVNDKFDNLVSGASVSFEVTGQAATASTSATTNASGVATMNVTIGTKVGANGVSAKVASLDAVTFSATSVPKPASTLTKTADLEAGALVSKKQSIGVKAADPHGNLVAGVLVKFEVTKGGGSASADTLRTDAQGTASVDVTLGKTPGDNEVRASVTTITTPITFTAKTVAGPPADMAALGSAPTALLAGLSYNDSIRVTIKDANGNPAPGVVVAFAVSAGGGSVTPASATTDAAGKAAAKFLTGVNAAANTATATVTGLPTVTFSVTTIEPVATVALGASIDSVLTRDSVAITATPKDKSGAALAGRTTTWSSSAAAIATVSTGGRVKGIAPGIAWIRAAVETKTDSFKVKVYTPPVSTVAVELKSDLIVAGATTEIASALLRADRGDTLTDKPVTWTSSAPGVAAIDAAGKLTAVAAGTTTLTATAGGKTATKTLTVEPRSRYEASCIFCIFTPSTNPRHPSFDFARNGTVPNPNDTRTQIVIDETFSVPAGQQVVWDNIIVWVRPKAVGNIVVRGTLIIRNSSVFWDQTSPQQTSLEIMGGGVLRGYNSLIMGANLLLYNFNYRDGATVDFDHFQSDGWTALEGAVSYTAVNASTVHLTPLVGTKNSTVTIRDAHSLSLEVYTPAGTYDLTFPTKQTWTDWSINDMWPGTKLNATNSYMTNLSAAALTPGSHVTVRNTDSFILSWAINKTTAGFVDCELRNLGSPGDNVGVLYADKTWDLPCVNSSLTLKNTRLVNAGLYEWGNVRLKVYDSNLADPHVYGGPATMEIYNSTLLNVFALAAGKVYLENVKIERDISADGANSEVYGYNLSSVKSGTPYQVYQTTGGKYIGLTSPGVPWNK